MKTGEFVTFDIPFLPHIRIDKRYKSNTILNIWVGGSVVGNANNIKDALYMVRNYVDDYIFVKRNAVENELEMVYSLVTEMQKPNWIDKYKTHDLEK